MIYLYEYLLNLIQMKKPHILVAGFFREHEFFSFTKVGVLNGWFSKDGFFSKDWISKHVERIIKVKLMAPSFISKHNAFKNR